MSNQDYLKNERLQNIRHTLAHLTAAAVRQLWPGSQNAIGPAIENGFYQDFEIAGSLTDKDLPRIEARIRKLIPTWTRFEKKEVTKEEALKEFAWNKYKTELIEEFAQEGKKLTFHNSPGFVDLCKGGHVESPSKEIKPDAFKLTHIAGAYWRGNEKNKMLTRIYGVAFESKQELDNHLAMLAEAEKRDHKILGPKLDLFMFHPTSPGMPYWLPKGMTVLNKLMEFWREEHAKRGYMETSTPLINKKELWETSGHWAHYKDNMFLSQMGDRGIPNSPQGDLGNKENETYGVKAMNCPNAMVIFGSKLRSYRDLPLRFSDADILHRYELAGTLNGLFRVRSFRQDDSHNFITEEMIESEYKEIFKIVKLFYGIFNIPYHFRLGTRPEGFLGDVDTWNRAEAALKKILEASKIEYAVAEGDGAFYGPKVDILMKDALGREWQMGTVQLDFQQPKRFGLEYIAKDGSRKTPVAIHRVIYGSIERFIGILIEHYAGAFPLWLSPVQVAILPISSKQNKYARAVEKELVLHDSSYRLHVDDRDESVGKKIREASLQKIPYQIIVGDKELKNKKISVRSREGKDLGLMSLKKFAEKLNTEIEKKK
ncbi:MAG: threonine--tRNA ligase [Candidatus Doudnabacteria bacterium]|nr:threonine--tRNA ligase [Candidatus Doudnabacteria bacterium]